MSAQALRVARDGASIILVNHFRSRWPVLNWLESAIDPICRRLGWRTDLSLEALLDTANVERGAERGEGTLFRIVYLKKTRNAARVVTLPEISEGTPDSKPRNRKRHSGIPRLRGAPTIRNACPRLLGL